ncbi:CDP-alcohol phosphatidyltransferase family protein [Angustibacter sp. McL0619]|uniref:CDP-alcohol phosphatidyltransferase family protein n=1 Tax=Angustibacter sp. McL0619 TaxID=3415676 RepID=UPI003CF8ACBD
MVQTGPLSGLVAQVGLLAALAGTVGVGAAGWAAGVGWTLTLTVVLAGAVVRHGRDRLGPADWVTLARATLAGGVAALVADSIIAGTSVPTARTWMLVGLAALALVLDGVDGRVARWTGTSSELGARFDMEVDAFLILVLSVLVAGSFGAWVLAIGLARYAFVSLGRLQPWLRASSPPRYWCKVVAVVQGVVLTAAAAQVLPHLVATLALLVALALLVESFGRQVCWLWLHRYDRRYEPVERVEPLVVVPVLAERS